MNETKPDYADLPTVKVRVIAIRSSQLHVILPDKRIGIIPKREWQWDRSVNKKDVKFIENQTIDAVLLPARTNSNKPYLSIRERDNPWDFAGKYKVGEYREAEVINLRNSAVYVQIEPGIVAKLWPKDIPLLPEQLPGDVLVVGDSVIVEITLLDIENKRIEVSLLGPIRANVPEDKTEEALLGYFKAALEAFREKVRLQDFPVLKKVQRSVLAVAPLKKLDSILLIENTPRDIQLMHTDLKTAFPEIQITNARNETEALKIFASNTFDLGIIDLNLDNGEKGTDIAEKFLKSHPGIPLVFISSAPFADTSIRNLEKKTRRYFPFAIKDWYFPSDGQNSNALIKTIKQLQEGIIEKHGSLSDEEDYINALEQTEKNALPLQDKLTTLLQELSTAPQANIALILSLDKRKRTIDLAAVWPSEYINLIEEALDGLYYSPPILKVLEEGQVFYLSKAEEGRRFLDIKNFFRNIPFRSCYGLPIHFFNAPAQYGLFVLSESPDLSWDTISRIRYAAAYTGLSLERERFMELLRPRQDFALRGELMATFIHEFTNKLGPLFDFVEEAQAQQSKGDPQKLWDYMQTAGPGLMQLRDLSIAYGRLAKEELVEVDLNQIVKKVQRQLEPRARENNIFFRVLSGVLPPIKAIPMHVEQVLTNIVLNAIQHIEEISGQSKVLNDRQGATSAELWAPPKMVLLKTCAMQDDSTCCILVMDTGGGVPYDLREKIFNLGYSTRKEGQGLGLFISRQLLEAMHGRLECVHSIRFYGSTFAIVFKTENKPGDERDKS